MMIRNAIGNLLEVFLVVFALGLSYQSYLFVGNINIFPSIEVNIAYYFFSKHSNRRSYIYLILFDVVLEHMILTNILSYLASTGFMQIRASNDEKSDLRRFIDVLIFVFIFLTTRYLIFSVYEARFFNYIDIVLQVITTSLSYPLVEGVFRIIAKVRAK